MTLPNGQVGHTYSATLVANGGQPPLTWSVTSGALPAGLSLNASTGAISGTPTATQDHASLSVQVQDSGTPAQTASENLQLTVSPQNITIAVSPKTAALTVGQRLTLSASTNDYAGLTWSISPQSGSFSQTTSSNNQSITLTTSTTGGSYTITASSVTDPARSSSIAVGVTDLAGVFTYHNTLARDGANSQEYALSPATVTTSTFGKLTSCTVDGAIYAQPLWMANLKIGSVVHNVVFVATAHDTLFAFDADAVPCTKLWSVNLIDSAHGATAGETTIPAGITGFLVGSGDGDAMPEVGVMGTPVIDPATGILYVVSKSTNAAGTSFYQRLHAIDVTTGAEKGSSPVTISGTYPGTGSGGSTVAFDPRPENQRAGLALVNGTVYIAWGSHEDAPPYYGWMMGYRFASNAFTRTAILNTAPNARKGGIWMSGSAPAADANNMIYVTTSNGDFNATSTTAPSNDYGDTFLKLSPSLTVQGYFTPSNQAQININNDDFGAGGATVISDLPAGSPVSHIAITGGKDGGLYVINRDNPGGFGDSHAWQRIQVGVQTAGLHGVLFAVGALWNNTLYVAGVGGPLKQYLLDTSTANFNLVSSGTSPSGGFKFPGSNPSVSANGSRNGVVWVLDNSAYCTAESPSCGAAVLHAYDASNVSKELWNSSMVGADKAGNAVKFTVPTVANGRVYVGTRGNNSGGAYGSSSVAGQLDVYGLKAN